MLIVNITKQIKERNIHVNIKDDIPKIYALVGQSGVGKTTILNVISGLVEAETCFIQVGNQILSDKSHIIKVQARKIGYLFQDYQLFPHMTVSENINYMSPEPKHINKLLKSLGIEYCLEQYPSTLSGGEAQRVALCRALSIKPNLLLLDEPFSSLDDETKAEGMELVKKIFKEWNIPIIIVTHSKKEASTLANEVIQI